MPASYLGACLNAAVDALRANATLATALGGAKVYTYVPQDTPAPYVWVTSGREGPWATTICHEGREVEIEAMIVSAYRGTLQLDTLTETVLGCLLDATTWQASPAFATALAVHFVEARRPEIETINGVLYFTRVVVVRLQVGD